MTSKKELKKIYLAKETYEFLIKKGIVDFSLNNFLTEIKMSKGNFYHYFASLDELFCTCISLKYEELIYKYNQPFEINDSRDKIKNFFFVYISKEKEINEYMKVMNELYYLYSNKKNINLYSYMQNLYKQTFYYFNELLKQEVDNRNLKKEILLMNKSIIATFDGMLTHSFMLEDYCLSEELENFVDELYNLYKTV